ncbi:CRISPR-associated endonuclease Cas3'' [Thermodesulfovibrio sp. TK110]
MNHSLFSAPEEDYSEHILKCKEKLEIILPQFLVVTKRIFDNSIDETCLKRSFSDMLLYHDLGKLTKKWQENIGKGKSLPSHAPIGAGFVYKKLSEESVPEDLRNATAFAIAIHHTDKGLLGDNIERPDVQAIIDGIVGYDGKIIWHENINELNAELFPEDAKNLNVNDLKDMARTLRIWSRGGGILEQHKRRLQAMLCHHILKLCDISAAVERKEYQKESDRDFYGGWLMVEEIRRYMEDFQKIRG